MLEYNINYKVVSVDDTTILVEYSCKEHNPVLVSIRKPYEYESLEDVIKEHSPAYMWSESSAKYLDVSSNASGNFTYLVDSPCRNPEADLDPHQLLGYRKKYVRQELKDLIDGQIVNTPLTIDGHEVVADSYGVACMSMYSVLAFNDPTFCAILRDCDGSHFYADRDMILRIAKEMALNINDHFKKEKHIASLIDAETDPEKLKGYLNV